MLASDIIRRVREIQIRTGRQVADVLAGEYVSVFRGGGVEFDELRPYVIGDDVRSIDWNVTARTGEPHVKRYVEERQLTLMLVTDVSASQDFGSGLRSKREAAAELSALLAFSAIRNDDKVGLVLFHGGIEHYIPPRKGQKHALRVVREVLAHDPDDAPARRRGLPASRRVSDPRTGRDAGTQGQTGRDGGRWRQLLARVRPRTLRTGREATDVAQALQFLLSVTRRKCVCFVISDFIDEGFEQALRTANRKHDVVAVLISDPREGEVPPLGLVALTDAETGRTGLYDTGSSAFRTRLAEAQAARVESLERRLRSAGIDFIHIDAAASVVDPLVRFFRMRERRSRR